MTTYRYMYGQIFLGGGLDIEVEADSEEEARAKARTAVSKLTVALSESQNVDGVRVAYAFEVTETVLGDSEV